MTLDGPDTFTAQDFLDAMRLALVSQSDPEQAQKVVQALLDRAPETEVNNGAYVLMDSVVQGILTFELVDG